MYHLILQNQVVIMQSLVALLYPYASDFPQMREVISAQLGKSIELSLTTLEKDLKK